MSTLLVGASWRYLYKRGSSFLKWRSNNEGALHSKKKKTKNKSNMLHIKLREISDEN
jgi:hypothetical protein